MDAARSPGTGDGGMNPEKREVVDQKLAAARRLIDERPELFGRQGSVVRTWRTVRGERRGPYFALRYRDAGRQRSLYLGRSPEVAGEVRRLLAGLQAPRQQSQQLARLRRAARAAVRQSKRAWQAELERVGWTLQGYEVRRVRVGE